MKILNMDKCLSYYVGQILFLLHIQKFSPPFPYLQFISLPGLSIQTQICSITYVAVILPSIFANGILKRHMQTSFLQ